MSKKQLWAALVEKALVKLHGVYRDLGGGVGAKAFLLLTGSPSKHFFHCKFGVASELLHDIYCLVYGTSMLCMIS